MITFGKTSTKPNHLFGKLPYYFKGNDTYKDGNDEGLLERYLQVFCAELDAEVSPYIDELPDIVDAEALSGLTRSDPLEFLNVISDVFGNPPDIGTEAQYITLLRHVVWILKTRGTKRSLELFLAIFGYAINTMTEAAATDISYDVEPTALEYDDSLIYDVGFNFYSNWNLVIEDYPGTTTGDPGSTWLDLLKDAIQQFISPIFATLIEVTYV